MRKFLMLLLAVCFISSTAKSQSEIKESTQKMDYDDETLRQLKSTTTVFFYSKEQYPNVDSLKQAVSEGWKFTPLLFADISELENYIADPRYSYFMIMRITVTTQSYTNTHYYLSLRLFEDVGKKGKVNTKGLCRIELYPNYSTLFASMNRKDPNQEVKNMYNKSAFYNWNPVLLKAQLQAVSMDLQNKTKPSLFTAIHSDDLSTLLANDTLYVPKTILMSFNAFSGKEAKKDEDFFEEYKFKYRIVSDEELYDIFETRHSGRLLFEYVKSSTDKFVTVYDLNAGTIVYKRYTPISYNLKSKDIARIE